MTHTTWQTIKTTLTTPLAKRMIIYSVGFWLPAIIFLSLADEVWEKEPLPGDMAVVHALQNIGQPWLDAVAVFITDLASSLVVIGLVGGIICALLFAKRYRDALFISVAAGGTVLINTVLKLIFARSRPEIVDRIVIETGYSFPSGHSMIAAALAMAAIVLCWHTKWRWLAVGIGGMYMLLVGLSRVYLGVHYPSDVVGGWCLSILWVCVVYKAMGKLAPKLVHKNKSEATDLS